MIELAYRTRIHVAKGRTSREFCCPECQRWIEINAEQFIGEKPVVHECGYSDTINLSQEAMEGCSIEPDGDGQYVRSFDHGM